MTKPIVSDAGRLRQAAPIVENPDDGILTMERDVDSDYTILERGMSISPTIKSTVTVATNAIWVIL